VYKYIIAGVAATLGLLVAGAAYIATPDWKKEKFHVIERDDAGVVAISGIHQEDKDTKLVFLLIYYAEVSDQGTQALVGPIEFNCSLQRAKYGIAYRLAADATVLGTLNARTPDWFQIMPNSPTADLYTIVCGGEVKPSQEAHS